VAKAEAVMSHDDLARLWAEANILRVEVEPNAAKQLRKVRRDEPDVSQAVDLGMTDALRDLAGMQRRIDGEVTVPGS
jgi:hypothetical protein